MQSFRLWYSTLNLPYNVYKCILFTYDVRGTKVTKHADLYVKVSNDIG